MEKQTIAECAERDDIVEALREVGVDYAQGYALKRADSIRSAASQERP
jgi:EAL domain-containing protein (putative c-di-GMP-specific phosphodiesterase class I)